MAATLRRPLASTLRQAPLYSSALRSISSSTASFCTAATDNTQAPSPARHLPPPQTYANPISTSTPHYRTRTPLEKQFETWIDKLRPGFTPDDVNEALLAQSDPDLALDIFRWTGQQRGYKHNDVTYLTVIQIADSSRRFYLAETLIEEVIAGACHPSLALYNSVIKICSQRKNLFRRGFDVYKKMMKTDDEIKPTLETYTHLFNALLRKFNKLNICYAYSHAVQSLTKQMKAAGVIPDAFVLNMIIKAHSKCLRLDEAIMIFREMGLYGCDPNEYTYSYMITGLCEKGRVNEGLGFYKELREKGLVLKSGTISVLICSLSMERRFEDAINVLYDMLDSSMAPDMLTYKTVLLEMCREGRGDDAFEILEELRKRDKSMNEKTYKILLNGLHFVGRE